MLFLRHLSGRRPPLNLKDAIERHTSTLETSGRSKGTLRTYRWHFELLRKFFSPERDVQDITHDDVVSYLKHLQRKRMSESTLNVAKAALAGLFEYLVEAGHLEKKPFKKMSYDKIVRRSPRVLDSGERRAVLAAALTPLHRFLFRVYLDLGLRLSEAMNLNVADFADTDVVRVIGKGKKIRKLAIPPPLREAFLGWLPEREKRLAKSRRRTGRTKVDQRALFITEWGTRMNSRTAQRQVKEVLKSIGLPDVRVHNLRHTLGKRLAIEGVHPRTIQDILGHANLSTTEIYTPTTRTDIRDALNSLGN